MIDPGNNSKQLIGTTPLLNFETTIGLYTIEVEKEDYFSNQTSIVVEHNELTNVGIGLEEKPGSILVSTSPENARVYLDGTFRGRSPIELDKIPRGTYQFSMGMPYAEHAQTISVEPNQQTRINNTFKKSKGYLIPATAMGVLIIALSLVAQ